MHPTALMNISGGVDSAYYAWRWLREHPYQTLLLHHCLLYERRKRLEKIATDAILAYFCREGLTNYTYKETTFSRIGIPGKIYDIEPLYFLTGLLLRPTKITTVIMPRCQEEVQGNEALAAHLSREGNSLNNFMGKNRVSMAIQLANLTVNRRLNFISPYQDKTKVEMIQEMPRELFDMTWYCRKPINGQPCHNCFNCERVNKVKSWKSQEPSFQNT